MVSITLKNVSFTKQGVKSLSDINLQIENEDYTIIVGPTGAGKTELVGIISGLYLPESGRILFDSKDVTKLPPNERHCGFMFESYALFPHLNILDNVSYARHMLTNNHDETYAISQELLNLVHLSNRDTALPRECSGGMQQRVALARALMAMESSGLLILDEPFKALDAGLRMNLRREVRNIAKSKELKLTTIHITNDMQEAMMADKIVVMDQGKIVQVGKPHEIMYSPVNLFVANFFSTEINYFNGKVLQIEENVNGKYFHEPSQQKIIIKTEEGYILYAKTERNFNVNDEVTFLIRSQYFKARHKKREDKTNNIVGKVRRVKFMGPWMRIELEAPFKDQPEGSSPQIKLLKVEVPTTKVATHNFIVGETITAYFPSEFVIVFPKIEQDVLISALQIH
jgi:ABC-type Fe3+/spermidine/putrescine transport system ATPase subunit